MVWVRKNHERKGKCVIERDEDLFSTKATTMTTTTTNANKYRKERSFMSPISFYCVKKKKKNQNAY